MTLPTTVKLVVRVVAGGARLVPVDARGWALLAELADHQGAIALVTVSIDEPAPWREHSLRRLALTAGKERHAS